ncbi:polyketide cyclase [Haloplanus salinus]|jgi:carbon monoxide dehydrogenase subunit G|uniref:Polyketide cyclase n=1 Tax=Haloplanus salinus TaxID=1126245 RepID=A0A368NEY1_9EURY|nr:SRPBCC family protein [Haloplanus salinus]RCU48144.1 polyketide cyclase [Haloplanus salinus]
MTVRVRRAFEFEAPAERVWEFISDPGKRAGAISVVRDYDVDGTDATWKIDLQLPLVDRTATVETEDIEREEPRYVKFVGRSSVMRVTGEHRIEDTETGCRLHNEFVVDGRLPGVERFFKKRLDAELDNLETALRRDLELPA